MMEGAVDRLEMLSDEQGDFIVSHEPDHPERRERKEDEIEGLDPIRDSPVLIEPNNEHSEESEENEGENPVPDIVYGFEKRLHMLKIRCIGPMFHKDRKIP